MLASDELMHVFKLVIEKGSTADQQLVVTAVWRLVANNYKAKHIFRCGTLISALWSLSRRLAQKEPHDDEALGELDFNLKLLRLIFEK